MPTISQDIIQLGTLGVLFLFAIKEFFAYLKSRNNGNNGDAFGKAIFSELQKMNSNHLHTIQKCIEDGNCRLIDTIHDDNTKIIELLSEIKGRLSK